MNKYFLTVASATALMLGACSEAPVAKEDAATAANRIAQETIITDGHIDVPYRLENKWVNVAEATEGGDFDYPRAMKGGLNAPFMSIYIPASTPEDGSASALANKLIDSMEKLANDNPDKFVVAHSVADVEKAFAEGKIALPLGMENGSPIENSLDNLKHFYERGIRYITLAHSKWNHISDSSYDSDKHWGGLSDFGKTLMTEMNNIGIMVDVSHISDGAFWQVMDIVKVPVIASHSSARHFTPGFERNMDDDMIKRLGENGGVIMINYGSSFVTEEANGFNAKRGPAYQAYLTKMGVEDSDDNRAAFGAVWSAENPYPFATLDQVLDHIDHVVMLTGSADYVGIGSDYDGVGDSLPVDLKDVTSYPKLVEGLLGRGYSEADIKKILSGNLLRVWREVEAYAAEN